MPSDNSCILGVFAKQPILGQAKTRLAEETSAAWVQQVAEAFLIDSLDRFNRIQTARALVYTPDSADIYFTSRAHGRYDCMMQGKGDLGTRLQSFFATSRGRGFTRIVAVGTDSPTLPIEYVEEAFQRLERNDVVIGPAFDGGYYLIGSVSKDLPIFDAIPWSTSGVLEATVDRVKKALLSLALLPPWYDVDTAADWAMLRGHVLAMRQARIDPGVPHIEQLIRSGVA